MGKLIVYTGPMKSGKTTKLIEQYNKTIIKNLKTFMFKPKIDNRWSNNNVVARNNDNIISSYLLDDIDSLWKFKDICDNFFIDEFQLLKCNNCTLNNPIFEIEKLLDENKNIWIAGLNLTAEKKSFGYMGDIMCLADKIYILKGNCDYCGKINKGVYTLYEGTKNGYILIGDKNYKCVCKKCYIKNFRKM